VITTEQIFQALYHGWPNKSWSLPNDYKDFDSDIIWHETDSKAPTLVEVEDFYKKISYIDKRIKHYPSVSEQLDILYHQGYEGWHNTIECIKNKFPKKDSEDLFNINRIFNNKQGRY
jgi:hypothetical protein